MNFDNRVCLVFFEGFTISITRSDDVLLFNGVLVFFPFFNDRIVVDGVNDILASQDNESVDFNITQQNEKVRMVLQLLKPLSHDGRSIHVFWVCLTWCGSWHNNKNWN